MSIRTIERNKTPDSPVRTLKTGLIKMVKTLRSQNFSLESDENQAYKHLKF
jgi:hypothetical protein